MAEERAAMEAFCADAFPRLVGALALHTGELHLAEELAQEALLRACRDWSRVGQLESPGGWAYRVGVNLASNRFRRRRAARRAEQRLAAQPHGHETPVADVAESMLVADALAALTDRQRQVVILRFYYGMSATQVGEVTGSSPGAVRAATHRALGSLRAELGRDLDVEIDEEAADVS